MADVSRSAYRGILYPDPRITRSSIWAAQSSYTQYGPRAGVPEPQQDSDLVLESSGTQSASKQLRVRVQKGGHPGGASISWKEEADTNWRGWNPPNAIQSWGSLVWTDGSSDPYGCSQTHAVALSDGTILCAYRRQHTTGPAGYKVYVAKRTPGGTWSQVAVTSTSLGNYDAWPCLVVLPDDSVLCYHWQYDSTATKMQVKAWRSTDSGATWEVAQRACLPAGIDVSSTSGAGNAGYDVRRIRAAYLAGQVLMIAELVYHNTSLTNVYVLRQYASDDLGASFTQIAETSSASAVAPYGAPYVLAAAGRFFIFRINYQLLPHVITVSNAFESIADIEDQYVSTQLISQTATTGFSGADLTAWVDDDGVIYVAGRSDSLITAERHAWIIGSSDNGATWTRFPDGGISGSDGIWWTAGSNTDPHPRNLAGVSALGRSWVFHTHNADVGDEDGSLSVFALGGWSTVVMPGREDTGAVGQFTRASWEQTWVPYEEPDDTTAWVAAGAGTDTLTGGYLSVSTTANQRYYTATPGTGGEMIVMFTVRVMSGGGSVSADDCTVRIRAAGASTHADVKIRMSDTGFVAYDVNAAAQVGSSVTGLSASLYRTILVGISQSTGTITTWYREHSGDPVNDTDYEWTAGPTGSLTLGGASSNQIVWGHQANTTTTSRWLQFHYTQGTYAGVGLGNGQSNPSELLGRTITTNPTYLDDGVSVRAVDGPGYAGQRWNIDTRYDYPISNVLPSVAPSPRRKWRATGTGQTDIAFDLGVVGDASMLSDTIGIYIDGANWRTGKISGYDGGAWTDIVTLDMATDRASLPYTRDGNTIKPSNTAHTAEHYIHHNELVGHTVDLGGGKLRRVLANTEGMWTNATQKKPIIYLAGIDDTEGASGTCSIWSTSALILAHIAGTTYRGLRLRIDSQSLVDNEHTIGTLVIGPVAYFGSDYSWGRVRGLEPNVFLRTAEDGTRQSKVLGPSRRFVEFAWADGVSTRGVSGEDPSDDYVKGSSTANSVPVASRHDAPYLMSGLIDHVNGSHGLVVYCPLIEKGTPDTLQYVHRERSLYGRIVSSAILEGVQGDEESGTDPEVLRMQTIRIEEEV